MVYGSVRARESQRPVSYLKAALSTHSAENSKMQWDTLKILLEDRNINTHTHVRTQTLTMKMKPHQRKWTAFLWVSRLAKITYQQV